MKFRSGVVEGVVWKPLTRHRCERGWLCELYRIDEISAIEMRPSMGYISVTEPGKVRGPHEHEYQTDRFCFLGPGDLRLYLWDMREDSPTFGSMQSVVVGTAYPVSVTVPPGVVHAYKNISSWPATVLNFPDRLYAGWNRQDVVDEIRHEDYTDTIFKME